MNKTDILDEINENFLIYAADTNNNKSFPDVRDGLKPGQRACLWAMYKAGFSSKKPHVKSAKIDGLVAANYWPHGTTAIYETFVRMSQPFSNNNPEIDFHGANGNIISGGDAFAADRYTEARLSEITEQGVLNGVDKNAVDMILNFSEDEEWPKVLPSVFPRLLVNGAQGIGVGIATEWTLHNLQETADMLVDYLKNGTVDNDNYYPDFPTGAIIVNENDLAAINKTGKGKIIVESKYSIHGKEIDFTEFPYQVYIEPLIEEIKAAIDSGKIVGIKEVNNKSDKKQTLMSVTCAASSNPNSVVEQLFQYTSLRKQFNINQMAVISKTPTLLTLEDFCREYKEHNISCIKREHEYDLAKTKERIEILLGYQIAIKNIDRITRIIQVSKKIKSELIQTFNFTERQVDAVLKMQLSRLARLEVDKLNQELKEKEQLALQLKKIVTSEDEQVSILISRLVKLAANFGVVRHTQVIQKEEIISPKVKKVKPTEPVVICYTANGYIKSVPAAKYRAVEGNIGRIETTTDGYIQIYNTSKVYRLKVDSIKQCLASEKGTPLGSLLGTGLTHINMIVACGEDKDVIAVSKNGRIKKFNTSIFDGTVQNIKGQDYFPKSEVIQVLNIDRYLTFITEQGKSMSVDISQLKVCGKTSTGRIGIKLDADDFVSYAKVSETLLSTLKSLGTKGK